MENDFHTVGMVDGNLPDSSIAKNGINEATISQKKNRRKPLYNKLSRKQLLDKVEDLPLQETASFYRYLKIEEPNRLRNLLYASFSELNVLGRVYVAHEGVNGQISFPIHAGKRVEMALSKLGLHGVSLNFAVENKTPSFYKLVVKIRRKIVDDGPYLTDFSKTGTKLDAQQFHVAMDEEGSVLVDVRNSYEYEVGHFENALGFHTSFFREQLPEIEAELKQRNPKKVLMYCTGGIRCEKASAYLLQRGFQNVNMLKGGVIEYARTLKNSNLKSRFVGKNFTFDMRLGERITENTISRCHQCGETSDHHRNCKNILCNLLFLQCEKCGQRFDGCCTTLCKHVAALDKDKQAEYLPRFTGKGKKNIYNAYASGSFALIKDVSQ